MGYADCGPESLLRIGLVPGRERLILCNEDISMAVAGQIHEAHVWILPFDVRQTGELAELVPPRIVRARKESWRRRSEFHQIEMTISREIKKLLAPAVQRSQRGTGRYIFDRSEMSLAKVPFVKPAVGLLAEHTGYALSIQVDPAVAVAVYARWKVLKTFRVNLLQRKLVIGQIVERANRVPEFKRRQRTLEIAWGRRCNPFETRLQYLRHEGSIEFFLISELGGMHQIVSNTQLVRKVMEKQNAWAKSVAAYLKT